MEFTVPNATFLRLNNVALGPDEPDEFNRSFFRSVRIEFSRGRKFALASNSHVLAIEYLGETPQADGAVNIRNTPALIDQCRKESQFMKDAAFTVQYNGGWAIVTSALGAMYVENMAVAGEWPDWRRIIPKELPKKTTGAPVFDAVHVHRLALSAPSGEFVLPKTFDASAPIFVRDIEHANWLGLFYRRDPSKNEAFPPAELPGWLA
jgi:hypothetical protein